MHSKDRLAEELRKIGLEEMAIKAESGYYHDYLSPLATPELQLSLDLVDASMAGNKHASELRHRHHAGEFDASKEESDAFMETPEGQELLKRLIRGDRYH